MENRLCNSGRKRVKKIDTQKRRAGIPIFFILAVAALSIAYLISFNVSADMDGVEFLIGMSQCNLGEPWRIQMNKELVSAASKYPDIKIIFTDAAQDNQKQIEDVRKLMRLGIDLLIISPNESEPLTPIVSEIYESIPVIVLDRKVNSDDYTLFIGADNRVIGQRAGEYVKDLLGETGGDIVEIMGLPGSKPTVERSEGFRESIASNPNIRIDEYLVANWLRDSAEDLFANYLHNNPTRKIDVVYSHNDPMALGAYRAALHLGRATDMVFIGIDGLKGEEGGITLVKNGILDITFIYPTGGEQAIESARDLLNGKKIQNKQIILDNIQVDKDNYILYG